MIKEDVLNCFGERIRNLLLNEDWKDINEIRIRTGRALILRRGAEEIFIDGTGKKISDLKRAFRAEKTDIEEIMNMISDYSLYAFSSQLKEGFITVPGGHRAAVAGTVVLDKHEISTIKNISSVSLRIASEKKGCAAQLVKKLFDNGLKNTLIVSPVCGGKTTILRDILRILSDGGKTVGISDERGEIAACYMGIPQLDVGERTDVLDCCPKAEGMSMLIRTMSPDIVAADEIGTKEDMAAIRQAGLCGSSVICTAHGDDMESIKKRFAGTDMFERYVFLEGRTCPGKVKALYDAGGERLW